MEIVNPNCATLCNYEVLKLLHNLKDKKIKKQGHLATITYETIQYLESTPCGAQTPENIGACLKALAPFNLNKSEMLMILNTPPSTALEIQLMIEESEERLTEDQVDKVLEIIVQHFPHIAKIKNEELEDDQT